MPRRSSRRLCASVSSPTSASSPAVSARRTTTARSRRWRACSARSSSSTRCSSARSKRSRAGMPSVCDGRTRTSRPGFGSRRRCRPAPSLSAWPERRPGLCSRPQGRRSSSCRDRRRSCGGSGRRPPRATPCVACFLARGRLTGRRFASMGSANRPSPVRSRRRAVTAVGWRRRCARETSRSTSTWSWTTAAGRRRKLSARRYASASASSCSRRTDGRSPSSCSSSVASGG